jgi:YHS domain-containing protein
LAARLDREVSQTIEITHFRLTHPFPVAYTRLTAQYRVFQLGQLMGLMEILGRILRFLFWLLVLSWSISLLKRLFSAQPRENGPTEGNQPMPEEPTGRKLVRDPVCGMHVAQELAISVRTGNELVHFCSAECRDRYLRENQKLAANG